MTDGIIQKVFDRNPPSNDAEWALVGRIKQELIEEIKKGMEYNPELNTVRLWLIGDNE